MSHPIRAALALLAVVIPVASCGGAPPAASEPATNVARKDVIELTEVQARNAAITIEPVRVQTQSDRIVAPGLVALDEARTARVGSLQEGLILETLAQVGDRVRPRELLARMHGHAMHDAWAGYRKAIADRRRLDKELAYAIDKHERTQRLYAAKAMSLQEVKRAEVDRAAAAEMVESAKAEVNRSIEELEHVGVSPPASEDVSEVEDDESAEQIPVRSPIGGVVLERLVTPGTTVTPGAPLFVVSDLTTLWVVAEIDESHLSQVRTGRPVEVRVAAYPNERFAGTITFIADTVNPKTRRVTVRSTVSNADGRLKPEMFATVTIGESEPRQMLLVPEAAIQTIDGRTSVFVAEAPGRFKPRSVELGAEGDGLIEVRSGLSNGESVAVNGSFVLKSELLKPAADGGN